MNRKVAVTARRQVAVRSLLQWMWAQTKTSMTSPKSRDWWWQLTTCPARRKRLQAAAKDPTAAAEQ